MPVNPVTAAYNEASDVARAMPLSAEEREAYLLDKLRDAYAEVYELRERVEEFDGEDGEREEFEEKISDLESEVEQSKDELRKAEDLLTSLKKDYDDVSEKAVAYRDAHRDVKQVLWHVCVQLDNDGDKNGALHAAINGVRGLKSVDIFNAVSERSLALAPGWAKLIESLVARVEAAAAKLKKSLSSQLKAGKRVTFNITLPVEKRSRRKRSER